MREGWTPSSDATVGRTPAHEAERRPLHDTRTATDDSQRGGYDGTRSLV